MKKIYIFNDLDKNEIDTILKCTNSFKKTFDKKEFVILNGDEAANITILLSGSLSVSKTDFAGKKIIVSDIKEKEVFGEAFLFSQKKSYGVDVLATTKSEILFIPFKKLINICSSACDCHNKIIHNLLFLLAQKNITLNEKLECLSQKTTQGKISFYLLREYEKNNNTKITIPFNREGLSEYLGVNRSALSRELSKLQEIGSIKFSKNVFEILDINALEEIIYPEE